MSVFMSQNVKNLLTFMLRCDIMEVQALLHLIIRRDFYGSIQNIIAMV